MFRVWCGAGAGADGGAGAGGDCAGNAVLAVIESFVGWRWVVMMRCVVGGNVVDVVVVVVYVANEAFVVTIVFWALLADGETFETSYSCTSLFSLFCPLGTGSAALIFFLRPASIP